MAVFDDSRRIMFDSLLQKFLVLQLPPVLEYTVDNQYIYRRFLLKLYHTGLRVVAAYCPGNYCGCEIDYVLSHWLSKDDFSGVLKERSQDDPVCLFLTKLQLASQIVQLGSNTGVKSLLDEKLAAFYFCSVGPSKIGPVSCMRSGEQGGLDSGYKSRANFCQLVLDTWKVRICLNKTNMSDYELGVKLNST